MKVIITQRVTSQIGEYEWDTHTDALILNDNDPISKITEWIKERGKAIAVGHAEISILQEKGGDE